MKKYLFRGGVLLAASALMSKLLGLWRDRLVVEIFSAESADLVYAAFRIPDFFYYLLVGATIGLVVVPRLQGLAAKEQHQYISSCWWAVGILFGGLSFAGILGARALVSIFASGFTPAEQHEIAALVSVLFGSVFILSASSVIGAFLQAKQRFVALALAPLFYMGSVALSLYYFGQTYGIAVIGWGAFAGAGLHLYITLCAYFLAGGKLFWAWQKPVKAWQNFGGDFGRRVLNNVAFQINQAVDIWVASFLVVGSVTAFALGTTVGHFLLSILGMAVANSAFPKLAQVKHDYGAQRKILQHSLLWLWSLSLPICALCALFSTEILQLILNLEGERLAMTDTVFWWTVVSLPLACALPVCSRLFLANDDTLTPLYATISSLTVATALAVYLSLYYLPPETAILGLALGNFTANTLGFVLFVILIWWKYERNV